MCRYRRAHARSVHERSACLETAVLSQDHPEPKHLIEVEAFLRRERLQTRGSNRDAPTAYPCRGAGPTTVFELIDRRRGTTYWVRVVSTPRLASVLLEEHGEFTQRPLVSNRSH